MIALHSGNDILFPSRKKYQLSPTDKTRRIYTMEIKKLVKKEVKSQLLANLPVVTLTEKDMSSVSGGLRYVTY